MDWNGLLNFQDDPQRNMLMQVGLGLLAGNQSGNAAAGAMRGFQNAQELINARQRQKFMEEEMAMRRGEFDLRKSEYERKLAQEQKARDSQARLMQGMGAYTTEQEVPVQSFHNVPIPAVEGAQAPNFGTARESVTTMQKKLVPNESMLREDLINVGMGGELIKNQYFPTKKDPIKLGKNERLIDPTTNQEIIGAMPSAEDLPAAVQEYQYAKDQGYQGSFLDYQLTQKRAGATNVSVPVNLGQKGFDNTLKLRGDFRSEPIYKAHQEVKSAYSQIQTALKEGTPVGDMAGATKIMKLLDPGSVVRESELGMAMAATGLEDRLRNYANMVVTGEKLTPLQRKEFQTLADGLFAESASQYNAKRGEYKDIADRNELNAIDVVGSDEKMPKKDKPAAKALPLPEKPNAMNLKKGSVYQTPKGALRWNGNAFEDL